jgi:hypothetical protein
MGYCSTVHLTFPTEKLPEVYSLLQENNLIYWISSDVLTLNSVTTFVIEDIKWYSSYDEIAAVENYAADNSTWFSLLRVGEDAADIEHLGLDPCEYDIYAYTEINNPGSPESLSTVKAQLQTTNPELFL